MNCPLLSEETTGMLLDFTAGRLCSEEQRILEEHMESCARCATFRGEQTALWSALDAWEPVPVSMDFNRRLWQRIDAAAEAPWYRQLADSLRLANWKPAVSLAAAALLVVAGFVLDHPARRTAAGPASAYSVSVSEADQIEQTLDDIQLLHQFDAVAGAADHDAKQM